MNRAPRVDTTDEAALWIARLRAHDVSDADRAQFAEWISNERHRSEFDALLELWERLSCVAHIAHRT